MSTSAFIKGMSAGLLVGSMVFMVCCKKKSPCGKKSMFGRALRNLGELVENVSDALGI